MRRGWQQAVIGLAALFGASTATADDTSPFAERLTRLLSPAQRSDERQLAGQRQQLVALPPLSPGHSGARVGFHSRYQERSDAPLELILDLGEAHVIERLAIFPVRGMFRGARLEGYGFPEHFLIDLVRDRDFTTPVVTLDSATAPTPRLPDYPLQFVLPEPVEARYVRLRVLEHWTREDGRFLTALGEVMALAEGRNIALHATVEGEAFITLPDWHSSHLVDGQTDLGIPVGPEPSSTNGLLTKGGSERLADKWIQLELPSLVMVDEIAVIPTQPVDAPDQFGHGFPRRFRLLVSQDASFENAVVLADYRKRPYPNPGDNAAVFSGGGVPARFVRLEASELSPISGGRFSLCLAELQVFADGENVALGATVTADDVFANPQYLDVWKPEYLVDGYSSQNRLIGLEAWLEGLAEREITEREIAALETAIAARAERTLRLYLGAAALVVLVSLVFVGMMIGRRKRALAEQQEALRARIARDLHDDLGSRLGGMRLLSESLSHAPKLPNDVRRDLELLHRSSGEATDAMRDIVWLLDTRERSLDRLRQQMKRLIPSIVGSLPTEFEVAEAPEAEVEFEFRRQVLLAFRESLANAARHSGSDRIACRVGGDTSRFWFEVRDWGCGFDEATVTRGQGLTNLRRRAEILVGKVAVTSEPGTGTMVQFSAPYRTPQPSPA